MCEAFNISLPTSWEEPTDKHLLLVCELFSRDLSAPEVKTLCLVKWNRLKVRTSLPDHRFLIKRKGEPEVVLSARQIQQATSELDFLDSFALTPVAISHIGRHKALAADFEKCPSSSTCMSITFFKVISTHRMTVCCSRWLRCRTSFIFSKSS